jgi:hypothetical protein
MANFCIKKREAGRGDKRIKRIKEEERIKEEGRE